MSPTTPSLPLARRQSDECLSDLKLDELLLDESSVDTAVHLATCDFCRARLAELQRLHVTMAAPEPSAVLAAALKSATARPSNLQRRRWAWSAAGTAAGLLAAAALILLQPARLPVRLKGGFALEIAVRHANGRVTSLLPGEPLASGEAMRFRVSSATDGYLVILGLDSALQVTAYAPTAGEALPFAATPSRTLEGSVILDESAGSERVVALRCARPFNVASAVEAGQRALAKAGGNPHAVEDLGLGCAQASTWFKKAAR
jgi:hypothetical protein